MTHHANELFSYNIICKERSYGTMWKYEILVLLKISNNGDLFVIVTKFYIYMSVY